MVGLIHFRPPPEDAITPDEQGRMAAGRGETIDACPYETADDILRWQTGWRARSAQMRRLREITPQDFRQDDA